MYPKYQFENWKHRSKKNDQLIFLQWWSWWRDRWIPLFDEMALLVSLPYWDRASKKSKIYESFLIPSIAFLCVCKSEDFAQKIFDKKYLQRKFKAWTHIYFIILLHYLSINRKLILEISNSIKQESKSYSTKLRRDNFSTFVQLFKHYTTHWARKSIPRIYNSTTISLSLFCSQLIFWYPDNFI